MTKKSRTQEVKTNRLTEPFLSIWDGPAPYRILPGASVEEWSGLVGHDYDEVDAIYTDFEVLGGE